MCSNHYIIIAISVDITSLGNRNAKIGSIICARVFKIDIKCCGNSHGGWTIVYKGSSSVRANIIARIVCSNHYIIVAVSINIACLGNRNAKITIAICARILEEDIMSGGGWYGWGAIVYKGCASVKAIIVTDICSNYYIIIAIVVDIPCSGNRTAKSGNIICARILEEDIMSGGGWHGWGAIVYKSSSSVKTNIIVRCFCPNHYIIIAIVVDIPCSGNRTAKTGSICAWVF